MQSLDLGSRSAVTTSGRSNQLVGMRGVRMDGGTLLSHECSKRGVGNGRDITNIPS